MAPHAHSSHSPRPPALRRPPPIALTDVVDEEPCGRRVRVEGNPERITESPGERLLALQPDARATGDVATRRACTKERVGRRDRAGRRDPKDLAQQNVLVTRGVIGAAAPAVSEVVAAAVTDADVEEAVVSEMEVAGIVNT